MTERGCETNKESSFLGPRDGASLMVTIHRLYTFSFTLVLRVYTVEEAASSLLTVQPTEADISGASPAQAVESAHAQAIKW